MTDILDLEDSPPVPTPIVEEFEDQSEARNPSPDPETPPSFQTPLERETQVPIPTPDQPTIPASPEIFLTPEVGEVFASPQSIESDPPQPRVLPRAIKLGLAVVFILLVVMVFEIKLKCLVFNCERPFIKSSNNRQVPDGMVYIPGGEFKMGRDLRDGGDEYASPAHLVFVPPFYIDAREVTREQYQKCVEVKTCKPPEGWSGASYPAGTGRWPVTGVKWDEAKIYAEWAGKQLPTEEQWEFAARGTDGRLYPWGQDWDPEKVNAERPREGLSAVGSFSEGANKLFDMAGNAWEWTASELRKYPDKKTYLVKEVRPDQFRVIRGGCYANDRKVVTTTYREALRISGEKTYAQTGFRCVWNVEGK